METRNIALVAALAALMAGPLEAEHEGVRGSVADGKAIAVEQCSNCHLVAADQPEKPILSEPTPSFEQIANRPTVNSRELARFIDDTHWDSRTFPMTMPNPMLMPDQVSSVVRYILSLRSEKLPPPIEPRLTGKAERIDEGEDLALHLCSYCHVVSSDRRFRVEIDRPTPSFFAIADDPKLNAPAIRHFIMTTHWDLKTTPMTMPNQSLSSEQVEQVVDYIESLKRRSQ